MDALSEARALTAASALEAPPRNSVVYLSSAARAASALRPSPFAAALSVRTDRVSKLSASPSSVASISPCYYSPRRIFCTASFVFFAAVSMSSPSFRAASKTSSACSGLFRAWASTLGYLFQ